jgi:hypothetical protein
VKTRKSEENAAANFINKVRESLKTRQFNDRIISLIGEAPSLPDQIPNIDALVEIDKLIDNALITASMIENYLRFLKGLCCLFFSSYSLSFSCVFAIH